jgi:flagellar biosynthesis protein FlhB
MKIIFIAIGIFLLAYSIYTLLFSSYYPGKIKSILGEYFKLDDKGKIDGNSHEFQDQLTKFLRENFDMLVKIIIVLLFWVWLAAGLIFSPIKLVFLIFILFTYISSKLLEKYEKLDNIYFIKFRGFINSCFIFYVLILLLS